MTCHRTCRPPRSRRCASPDAWSGSSPPRLWCRSRLAGSRQPTAALASRRPLAARTWCRHRRWRPDWTRAPWSRRPSARCRPRLNQRHCSWHSCLDSGANPRGVAPQHDETYRVTRTVEGGQPPGALVGDLRVRRPGADLGQVGETVTRGLGPPLPFAPGSLYGLMVGLPL